MVTPTSLASSSVMAVLPLAAGSTTIVLKPAENDRLFEAVRITGITAHVNIGVPVGRLVVTLTIIE